MRAPPVGGGAFGNYGHNYTIINAGISYLHLPFFLYISKRFAKPPNPPSTLSLEIYLFINILHRIEDFSIILLEL